MGEVINILKSKPHISGDALCLGCGHTWVAVAQIGSTVIECPQCEANKGIFINLCCRFEYPHLTCSCSNDFLHVTPEGFYCPNCGQWVIS